MNQSEDHRPVIGFAHRGARAHAPENTIEGFLTAIRMGAKALETDVWLTRDGVAMLAHDGKLGRGRPISATDHAEMPALMPTLRRLGEVVSPDTDLSIDVKDPAAIEAILAARADTGASALRHTWLCDPEPDRLAGWRSLDPDVHLVASLGQRGLRTVSLQGLSTRGISVLNLRHPLWSRGRVQNVHRAGLAAFAWGVQCPLRMRQLIGWGIDAIYSDHTDRMVRAIGSPPTATPVG